MTNSNSSSTTSNERLRRDSWRERSRRDPDDGYAWLMAHRRLRGQPLQHLPALEAIARDDHPFVVVQKSAQTGLTELFVGLAFWAAATTLGDRGNVLFLMPQQNQMDDFAQARFDRAIEESPDLQRLLQPLTGKAADRLRLKRVGDGHIFLRGADNAHQVASVDADLVLLDEYDQMPDGTLERAETRLASSAQGRLRIASTPRFPEAGINGLFLQSDQRRSQDARDRLPGLPRAAGRDPARALGGGGARQHPHPRLSPEPALQPLAGPGDAGRAQRTRGAGGAAGFPEQRPGRGLQSAQ